MSKERIKKIFLIIISVYIALAVSFYFLAGEQLNYKESVNNIVMPDADGISEEIIKGITVKQDFECEIDNIEEVALVFTTFYRTGSGRLTVSLNDGKTQLYKKVFDVKEIPEQHRIYLRPENPIKNVKGKTLTLSIFSNSEEGEGVAAMMSKQSPFDNAVFQYGDKELKGALCFSVNGTDNIYAGQYYWYIMGCIGLALAGLLYRSYKLYEKGKADYIVAAINAVHRYKFLISQLVIRDFKSKYKRSILGIFWSFLNPLLTMTVQFLVFSTFFQADTQNYPIYLLSGVVCFSFFNECTTMCLSSISGNARLITKVYIPKYIFPLARTISSSVNLGISLIPLLLACLVLGISIKPQALLFLYFLICLVIFSLGVGLFLSALMVFFRDIQFLWTVLTQIWMYATPIFYPAEIVPEKYRFILRINPLYHFIGNARTCLISGVSPEPKAYIFCFLFAMISLIVGAYTFKKTQDEFALYL